MTKPLLRVFLFILTASFMGCGPEPLPSKPVLSNTGQLVYYTNSLLQRIASSHDSLVYQPADFEVSVNRLVYQTTLNDGTTITASGVVYLPSQATPHKPYPLLSFQHPTAFSNAEAPSGANFSVVRFSYPLYFATHGYIVACPDYIGYGAADAVPHDYEHRQTLAQATVDMLLATKEFLARRNVVWNDQVFLTGYSEGGYASLSAQKLVEERYPDELHLAGSSCGAGPYAMPAFYDYVTQKATVGGVANHLYVWETLTYDRVYGLNKPVSYYFKSPYAEQITQSLDNARKIPVSFHQICTDPFRADIRNSSSSFRKALADNDLTNWSARTATQLIHGEQDEIIPFLMSQQTYASLRQRGSSNLNLVVLKSGLHVPTEFLFMRRTLDWFERLRK